jgi:hypothetical protein
MLLFPPPITKEEFEQELLTLPPREANSRREFWILCDVLQGLEGVRCPPPDWFVPMLNEVLERPSDDRAEGLRHLRHLVLECLTEYQKKEPLGRRSRNP